MIKRCPGCRSEHTFEETSSCIVSHTEGVHRLDNLQESSEMVSHVLFALRANALQSSRSGRRQLSILKAA